MPTQPENIETDSRFPSGEWCGFFMQGKVSRRRFRMDLYLTFREGSFAGEGKDLVGKFLIKGSYNLTSGEVTFHKHYIGKHSVFYRGFNEGKGIWGIWELSIRQSTFTDRGGFHIWPKAMRDPTGEYLKAEEEVPIAIEEQVLVDAIAGTPA